MSQIKDRTILTGCEDGHRRSHAYKLLVHIMYTSLYDHISVNDLGVVTIENLSHMALFLSIQPRTIKGELEWLKDMGYLEYLSFPSDTRKAHLRVRQPNISGGPVDPRNRRRVVQHFGRSFGD